MRVSIGSTEDLSDFRVAEHHFKETPQDCQAADRNVQK